MLSFFAGPAAFGCPHTVEGFNLWREAAFVGAPWLAQSQGTGAVPFWFVPAEVIQEAMQDGTLTMDELAALPGRLVGHATQFNEVLHPDPLPPHLGGGGGHPNPKHVINAQGTLNDGRRFQFHLTWLQGQGVTSIRLRFW